jgi:hypothetical protein
MVGCRRTPQFSYEQIKEKRARSARNPHLVRQLQRMVGSGSGPR